MVSTRSASPSGTERSSATDVSTDASSIVEWMANLHTEDEAVVCGQTIQDILNDSRILITGAALLHRLLCESTLKIKQVVAIVRGKTDEASKRLANKDSRKVGKTETVIHCAGDTRFTLSISQAFESMADLAYFTACFSLLACKVGRKLHGKTCRIVRLATLGPAIDLPRDAWGAGHPSSPICAALAAQVVDPKMIFPTSGLDVVPVDITVNQILAIAASAHALQKLATTHRLHPKNAAGPTSKHLAQVACNHVTLHSHGKSAQGVRCIHDKNRRIRRCAC
ncbi:hypothetical protein NDA18_000152 [Ustilago nuda]|nr:hypothetical protein NDA18_000152 [Ustilago nuda]